MENKKFCEKCGHEHNGSYGTGKFCSKSCSRSRIITKEQIELCRITKEKKKAIINANKIIEIKQLYCEECGIEIDGSYGSGRFCSSYCSHKYSTKNDNNLETKEAKCVKCGSDIIVNKRNSIKKCLCNICKLEYQRKRFNNVDCKMCGSIKGQCKHPEICKRYQIIPNLIKYFGFDKNVLGTKNYYEEFERIRIMLYEDYYDEKLSTSDMSEKYGYSLSNFNKVINYFNIKLRCFSESTGNAIIHGKLNVINKNSHYKHGYHTTWNNKQIFYRSGYELEYANQLDKDKINYEVEKLRISYWDTQLLKQRTAIPDFYLPDTNLIVEIKSNYTYNEQNMKDKLKAYKEHGYNFKLILDHKDVILEI
jgi:hypothetical protein